MANGQLGTLGNGVQLGTGSPPSQDTTKDVEYWRVSNSIAGSASPPLWDTWRAWGIMGAGNATTDSFPDDVLMAIPQPFNRAGTINKIALYYVAAGNGNFVFSLYGNVLDGAVFPGTLLTQSSELAFTAAGGIVTWTPNYVLTTPGQLIWLVMAHKGGSFQSSSVACSQWGLGLLGSVAIGGNIGPSFAVSPIQQTALTVTSTYNAIQPAQFPQSGTFKQYPTNSPSAQMPQASYRFVKS